MTEAARALIAFLSEAGSQRTDLVHSPEVARLQGRRAAGGGEKGRNLLRLPRQQALPH